MNMVGNFVRIGVWVRKRIFDRKGKPMAPGNS